MSPREFAVETLVDELHRRMEAISVAAQDAAAAHARLLQAGQYLEQQKELHREQVEVLVERMRSVTPRPAE